jgi:hypothetical protein
VACCYFFFFFGDISSALFFWSTLPYLTEQLLLISLIYIWCRTWYVSFLCRNIAGTDKPSNGNRPPDRSGQFRYVFVLGMHKMLLGLSVIVFSWLTLEILTAELFSKEFVFVYVRVCTSLWACRHMCCNPLFFVLAESTLGCWILDFYELFNCKVFIFFPYRLEYCSICLNSVLF